MCAVLRLAVSTGDLRQPLADFNEAVASLDKTRARIRSLGKDVRAKEAAYQSSSAKELEEIESADLRRTVEQGRASVAASFKSLEDKSESLRTRYEEWESTVKSIQSSLEGNLSADNLKSLQGKIKEVTASSPALEEGMRTFANDLQSVSASMNPQA